MSRLRVSSRSSLAAGLVACILAGVLAGPARAQYFEGFGAPGDARGYALGPRQVRASLERRGFQVLAPLRRNEGVYVADVLDRMGRRERLVVDMADGGILQRFIVDDGEADGFLPDVERRGGGVYNPYGNPRPGGYAPRAPGGGYATPRGDGLLLDGRPVPDGSEARREGDGRIDAPRQAIVPPLRYVRPPVERGDDTRSSVHSEREAPRLRAAPTVEAPPTVSRPVRPAEPARVEPSRPSAPADEVAGAQAAPRRMSNPLAIPGGSAQGAVRSVSPGITGAPPARAGRDGVAVPPAPLD